MKMAEEAQQMQMKMLQQQMEQQAEMFPLQKEALATQVETGKFNLQNQRLWSLYQQGVAPSKISDPVLRGQYEPFFNYMNAVKSLEAVQSEGDLQQVLGRVGEEHRPTIELLGRAQLHNNQMRDEILQRQLKGLDINLATSEYQLRSAQLNSALNAVLSNIDREGTAWDKRPPQQKIEAVQKWLKEMGLEQAVPPSFAQMFQKVQSSDARQLFLLRAQTEYSLRANMALAQQQASANLALQREAMMGNLVFGALQQPQQQQGFLGVPPVGFALPKPPPIPMIFKNTYDNRGSNINQSGLENYLKIPMDIPVPVSVGNQPATMMLSDLGTQAGAIYNNLGTANPTISAEDINTLVYYDAGLIMASALSGNTQVGWDFALTEAVRRVLSTLKSNRAYQANANNYKTIVDNWERAWQRKVAQRQQAQPATTPQSAPKSAPALTGKAPLDNMRQTLQRGGQ
jgi:hypothetical protein